MEYDRYVILSLYFTMYINIYIYIYIYIYIIYVLALSAFCIECQILDINSVRHFFKTVIF